MSGSFGKFGSCQKEPGAVRRGGAGSAIRRGRRREEEEPAREHKKTSRGNHLGLLGCPLGELRLLLLLRPLGSSLVVRLIPRFRPSARGWERDKGGVATSVPEGERSRGLGGLFRTSFCFSCLAFIVASCSVRSAEMCLQPMRSRAAWETLPDSMALRGRDYKKSPERGRR